MSGRAVSQNSSTADPPGRSYGKRRGLMPGTGEAVQTFRHRICELPDQGWERIWVWCSERVNPIVVKEVRQSLKSRQFTISFGLTLLAAIGWTIIAVSLMVPRIYYVPGGMPLLTGFFCVLAVPLMAIIPFSAFRSLISETEDSTFELLSISALSAEQIVKGKMASAGVQIILYLSALAPCIVLTYLLRGVGLFSILFLLGLTVTFSVVETAAALLVASVARTRMLQNGASVLVLAGLLIALFSWITLVVGEGVDEFSNPPREIYVVMFAVLTILAVAISLALRTASAAIDFPSENHSTPIRLRIVGVLVLVLFWSLLGIIATKEADPAWVLLVGVFSVLMFVGGLITGERGVISPRAQRTLPKTFLGRIFLTWLYPGAGLGYVFLVCLFGALVATLSLVELYYQSTLQSFFRRDSVLLVGYLLLCYLAIYPGLNRLIMLCTARQLPGRMLASLAMLIVLVLLVHLIPLVTVYYLNDYREFDYAWHQAFNIFWSIDEAFRTFSSDMGASVAILTLCALGVFGLNLVVSTRDVMLVRVAAPPRVAEEEGQPESRPAPTQDPFAD